MLVGLFAPVLLVQWSGIGWVARELLGTHDWVHVCQHEAAYRAAPPLLRGVTRVAA